VTKTKKKIIYFTEIALQNHKKFKSLSVLMAFSCRYVNIILNIELNGV